jgi:hypothetical protein
MEAVMRNKKDFIPLFFIFIIASLLHSCNLSVTVATPTQPVAASITIMPAASPTSTLTFTPPATITPLPTLMFLFVPTITPTPQWAACPGIVITQTYTNKGDMLHILRCEDGLEYDLGPLAKGVYAVGPNDKFLVYITSGGIVYASKIGKPYLNILYDLAHERIFTAFNKGFAPDFKISFVEGTLNFKLVLLEKNYDQKRVYDLPTWITH